MKFGVIWKKNAHGLVKIESTKYNSFGSKMYIFEVQDVKVCDHPISSRGKVLLTQTIIECYVRFPRTYCGSATRTNNYEMFCFQLWCHYCSLVERPTPLTLFLNVVEICCGNNLKDFGWYILTSWLYILGQH